MNPLLQLHAVGHSWPDGFTLGPLDLAVLPGQRVAILGEEGSGKSRLLRLLTGLQPPATGTILLEGEPLAHHPRRGALLGVVFHDADRRYLAPTVREELTLALPTATPDAIHTILEQVALPATLAERNLWELSAAQGWRVGLAAALLRQPRLLILDEPGGMLSTAGEIQLAALLHNLAHHHSLAQIILTSRPERAAWSGDVIHHLRANGMERSLL